MAGTREEAVGSFGIILRRLRDAAGLTQEELAEAAGLSAKAIGALERGERRRPHPHTVRSLATALGLSDEDRTLLLAAAAPRTRAQQEAPADAADLVAPGGRTGQPNEPPTALIGRDALVAELVEALTDPEGPRGGRTPLATLTGPGGVGKTRLALRVASVLSSELDEVRVVRLAPVRDTAGVVTAVASALGVVSLGPTPAIDLIVEHLLGRPALLVLDNLEHVMEAAGFVAELIRRCPDLRILATSRSRLRLRGEREIAVPPLQLPEPGAVGRAAAAQAPAMQLLLDRARDGDPSFVLSEDNAEHLVTLCRRLDGLPLALELAAAQLRFLDPAALLGRLDRVLSTEGPRDLPARQRTMRSTLAWSYDLLPPAERALFRRLSVFAGSFDIDAAESVLPDPPGADPEVAIARDDVIVLLGRLVEQSLVVVERSGDGVRYRLLEPVRQYAHELLDEDDECAGALHARHADHYAARVDGLAQRVRGHDQVVALTRATADLPDLRAAMSWAADSGRHATAAHICWELWPYMWLAGAHDEAIAELDRMLAADLDDVWRGRVAGVAAAFSYAAGKFERCAELSAQAIALGESADDARARSHGRTGLGLLALAAGDVDAADEHLIRAHDDFLLGGEPSMAGTTLTWRAAAAAARGDTAAAQELLMEALDRAIRLGDRQLRHSVLYPLAMGALAAGDHSGAAGLFGQGLMLAEEIEDRAGLYHFAEGLAVAEALRGQHGRAAWLFGAADALKESLTAPVYHYFRTDPEMTDRARGLVAEALGPEAMNEALQRGRATSPAALAVAVAAGGTPLPYSV